MVGTSFGLLDSRFFSSVRKNTLMVVRNALCGLQSSADSGECSQTGHELGSVDWQFSQMACSQHGRRNALTASLLQMAHRSFAGMSSCGRQLFWGCQRHATRPGDEKPAYLMSSTCASVRVNDAAIFSSLFLLALQSATDTLPHPGRGLKGITRWESSSTPRWQKAAGTVKCGNECPKTN